MTASTAKASRSRRSRNHGKPASRTVPVMSRRMTRQMLLAGASVLALALGSPNAQAVTVGSSGGGAGTSATSAAAYAAQLAQQQAQQAAQNAQQALSRATHALQSLQSVQAAARAAAAAASTTVTNGLSAGGLIVDPRIGTDPSLWVNAKAPTQSTSNGQTTVTVEQTAQRAIMTWQQYNIGKDTTLYYDQRGGNSANGNSWVALNRIDATGSPSQILGQIKAEGTVLIINPNGIIFTGTSQINVHSLIASAMDLNSFTGTANGAFKASGNAYLPVTVAGIAQTTANGTPILAPSDEANANATFLNNGLFVNSSFQTLINGNTVATGGTALFSAGLVPGQSNIGIRVEAGASISTDVSGFDNGGFVALLGPQVSNSGSITTSAGQIILAAGSSVQIAEPASGSAQTSNLVRAGSGITGTLLYTPPSLSGGALVLNDGVLISSRGNITLNGDAVDQFGIAEATTSITRAGSITIAANGTGQSNQVVFGTSSLTAILPEENGESIPSDATSLATFTGPRIDVAAGYVDFQSGSWVLAPSATMALTGPGQGNQPDGSAPLPLGRVLMEAGSTIDLSGLTTTRSVSDYLYTFKVTANDVADTPLAQNLIGQTVTIDLTLTGTRADGETWVGSPLFASSGAGYLANVAQGIDQLLTKGGSLTFGSGVSVGNGQAAAGFVDVLQAAGSVLNVSGGLIQLTGAQIATTRLVGSDGRRYDIGSANPFIGNTVAGGFVVQHMVGGQVASNLTEVYNNALGGKGYYKEGFVDGVSAGGVSVTAVNPILEGDIVGDIVIGTHQRQLAQAGTGTGGAQATPDELPNGASLTIALTPNGDKNGPLDAVILDASASPVLGSGFTLGSSLVLPTSADGAQTITYATDRLSAFGLGSISISGADTLSMAAGASLSVRDGGSIKLTGATTIDGTLIAHGGSITISGVPARLGASTLPDLVIGAQALLDVSGRWINDSGLSSDGFTGQLYINGGSISLSTFNLSKEVSYNLSTEIVIAEDRSASIILQSGSIIDVSSGGYVGTSGKLALGSDGLPKGKGGNLSLLTYAGTWTGSTGVDAVAHGNASKVDFAPQTATNANVFMDGTIYAGGLSQGGTFTLQVPQTTIDGQATAVSSVATGAQAGTVVLPTSFFADSGFGSFKLTSTYGSTTVTAGTTVTLKQQNYRIAAPTDLPGTGARLRDFSALGYAPDGVRHAMNLTLSQNAYAWGVAGDRSATAQLLIDEGVRIVADPLANISLNAGGPAVILGSITAPGGSISINQGFSPAVALTHDGLPQYIWIGENAVLDVSGTLVPNPLITTYSTGSVLAGGSITLSSSGVIVALKGSTFDIAGASGTVEVPAATSLNGPRTVTQEVWSNGGSLTLSTSGDADTMSYHSLYFAGTIEAAGGAPQAAGGTLNIGITAGGILVSQGGDVAASFGSAMPTTRTQLRTLSPTTSAIYEITADTIDTANSGLDTVSFTGPLYFSGNVDLKVTGSILINNSAYATTLLPAGVIDTAYSVPACTPTTSCIPTIGGTNVTLEAGYVRFTGTNVNSDFAILPTLADGTLTLKGDKGLDLVGTPVIRNAGTVNLVSDGDIRLTGTFNVSTSSGATSDGYGGIPWAGGFLVADNLNITAREIYPTTGTAYLLMSLGLAPSGASGTHSTITFASSGETPVAPLSAGGAIVVDAKTIVQGGALYAPLGTIQLGFGAGQKLPGIFTVFGSPSDPYDPVEVGNSFGLFGPRITTVTTESVTLTSGSLTSVSANGLTISYGTTTDGTDWAFNNTLLNGPSAKLIVLGGSKVETQTGAVIDGSGGGDVYATEFVPGTGGSRNVLTTTTQTVYAIVPGYNSALAAYDPSFTTTAAAGSTVTIAGGNGIPAGTYTLLPAEYATLPGAYRVVVVSTSTNPAAKTTTTADGSVYMTGTLGNAINGSHSSQTALLEIQSNAVWTKYTEIDIAKGNSYFPALAATNGTATPRLAQDAANIVVAASASLALNATNRFAPADGGLGGQLDITGTNLVVAASDQLANFGTVTNGSFTPNSSYAGYLFLDSDMLSHLGIESTLIGGYRSATTGGTLITATALNLEIATDAAHALTGPELLFTSLAPTAANANVRGLVVDAGSVITAKGTVSGNATAALVIGVDPVATKNSDGSIQSWSTGVSGDGALLRVSNGGLVDVVRHFVPGVYQVPSTTPAPTGPVSTFARGSLAIGAGVVLSGNTLTLDSSGTTTVPVSASLTAKNYDLSGGIVNLGGGSGGLVVSTDLIGKFAGADAVRLRSGSVFNIYGSNTFGDAANPIGTLTLDGAGLYSDGGTTTIDARNIVLMNSQATANVNGANTGGSGGKLVLGADDTLTFGAGTKTLAGFASVTATAGSKVLFTGTGSLDARAAAVSLTAPLFLVGAATSQSLITTGALSLVQGAGTAPDLDPTVIGGTLSLKGGSIDVNGTLAALGGSLTLEATAGDLTLSGNALLTAAGTRIVIGDLIQDTPAGNIRLYADLGNVMLGGGTTVDVSGAGSGYAGTLAIYAGGTATLSGMLNGAARYSDLGGEFALIANRLDGGLPLGAGFTRSFEVSLGQGKITIAAGETLKSENVLLVANSDGIFIDGTIDASAASGGSIGLYGAGSSTALAGTDGASGVTIGANARLYARYQAADVNSPGYADGESTLVERGGTITLGTTGTPDRDANNVITVNGSYGYENVSGSGAITVASGAIFDVSGGSGGKDIDTTGGSVVIRAPILTATSPTAPNAINVSFNGTVVTNAKADGSASGDPLVVNAFAVWSTTDNSTDPNKHFDGIIDPAGFFDATGAQIINPTGGLYPTSTADAPATGAYLPHVIFYQKTLLDFVNNPFDSNAVAASFAGAQLNLKLHTTATDSDPNLARVGLGSKTLMAGKGLRIAAGQRVFVADSSNSANTMTGSVSSYDPVTGTLVIDATQSTGAGTPVAWNVVVDNIVAATPATGLRLRPEIDLVNPSTSINNGNITVASNWNFGAGSLDTNGNVNLLYRTTNGREPGTLVLRAANNVKINATITDGFFVDYNIGSAAESAASLYAAEANSSLYKDAYSNMFSSNGELIYDSTGITSILAYYGVTWADVGVDAPAAQAVASASFFNISQSVFNTLQFKLQEPTILSCGGACSAQVIDQYNQYYAQYVKMFHAYVTETVAENTAPLSSLYGVDGGVYLPYSRAVEVSSVFGGAGYDPSTYLAIPTAPTLSTSYYSRNSTISFSGGGWASTGATDYATNWTTYFFNVINLSMGNVNNVLTDYVSRPTLDNVPGLMSRIGNYFAIPVTPPYAPPAYTTLATDYHTSLVLNPTPPTNMIANNPAVYSVGNVAYYNTTSSANLMTAAASGKGSFSYDIVGGGLFSVDGTSSVDPNAVMQVSSLTSSLTGNVTIDGHTSYINTIRSTNQNNQFTAVVPTMVRTGTGSITIAAAGDFALLDQVSPGTVYTAGYVADNAAGFTAPTLPTTTASNGLLTTPVWATGGGNIIVTAGRDIIGIETPTDTGNQYSNDGSSVGVSTGEFWSAWYYVNGNSTGSATAPFDPSAGGVQYSSWVNYGTFFQGFGALGGGNITLKAGHNVKDVSASLPETIQTSGGQSASGAAATAHYYGGGDLLVEAGNDVLSGVYYVGRGTGTIRAGGSVVSDATLYTSNPISSSYNLSIAAPFTGTKTQFSVPLLLAVQDGYISVQAAGDIDLGGIFEPTQIPADLVRNMINGSGNHDQAVRTLPSAIGASFNSYGPDSGVTLTSQSGSIAFNTLAQPSLGSGGFTNTLFTHGGTSYVGGAQPNDAIPATLSLTALTGDITLLNSSASSGVLTLYGSTSSALSLIAGGDLTGTIRMTGGNDTPALIYAGNDIQNATFTLSDPAVMWAGRDIVSSTLVAQNNADDDITSIFAGRDIRTSSLTLYGPGDFVIEAGRDIGPFFSFNPTNTTTNIVGKLGIFAIGDGSNAGSTLTPVISSLPHQAANITLRYGIAKGIDYAAAIAKYGDAATAKASGIDFVSGIVPQLEQLVDQLIVQQAKAAGIANPIVAVTLTPAEAADLFTALSSVDVNAKLTALAAKAGLGGLAFNMTPAQFVGLLQQQEAMKLEIDRGFLAVLKQVGLDYNDPSSPYAGKYARAYEAIATLFPASLGYTDNSGGGSGVAPVLKHTGDLRMARALVETQTGGDVSILGPGGNAYVGSNRADASSSNAQGVLTLAGGSIRTYTDESVLIYQSRVFTEQGGNVEMFSANGDLNAGKGKKSSAAYPPLRLICDSDGYCRVNPVGLVTGAGIGALISVPGQDPTESNVVLSTPHGVIDAGAAGIRVSGDLSIIGPLLNAFNTQVGGTTTGIPVAAAPPMAAVTSAANTAAATQQSGLPSQSNSNGQTSVMIVEIIGYGGAQGTEDNDDNGRRRMNRGEGQDPTNRVQVLGVGRLTEAQRRQLVEEKRQSVGRQ